MRPSGSKVGIGLDPDGFSSSLDLMKTTGSSVSVSNLLRFPVVIQMKLSFRRVKKCRNLLTMWFKPMVGSRRFLRPNSTSVDDFLSYMI